MESRSETQSQGVSDDDEPFVDPRLRMGMRFPNFMQFKLPSPEISVEESMKHQIMKKKRERFEQTPPCFLDSYPRCRRSKLRIENEKTPYVQKKLDSATFERHLENLWRSISEERRGLFTLLDSLWFNLYLKAASKEKVLSWIKHRNIFLKKYVFVPIVCWSHWSLLIFCHFGEDLFSSTIKPCMILLDSLQMTDPRRLEPNIRKFVLDIYRAEGIPETNDVISQIPLLVPKVPQQKREECGSFVLYFIHLFAESAPENFSISEGYPYFMNPDWFTRESFEHFCKDLDSQLVIEADETRVYSMLLEESFDSSSIIILDD
ncbi:hypothetical protein Dimus_023724 [Dionaea muscipula]